MRGLRGLVKGTFRCDCSESLARSIDHCCQPPSASSFVLSQQWHFVNLLHQVAPDKMQGLIAEGTLYVAWLPPLPPACDCTVTAAAAGIVSSASYQATINQLSRIWGYERTRVPRSASGSSKAATIRALCPRNRKNFRWHTATPHTQRVTCMPMASNLVPPTKHVKSRGVVIT